MSNAKQGPSRHRSRRGTGQAMVEFALVIPIFLVVLAAIIYFGFMLFSKMSVINAAREGARVAAMTADVTQIQNVTSSRVSSAAASGGLAPGLIGVTTTCVPPSLRTPPVSSCTLTLHTASNPSGAQQGDSVSVVVTYPFTNPIPMHLQLLGNVIIDLPSSFTLSSTVQMVLDSVTSG